MCLLLWEDFVPGGKCPGRILCWEDFVPGGFCVFQGWEDFEPGRILCREANMLHPLITSSVEIVKI